MAQVEFFLDVPGAGRLVCVGKIPHDAPLGRGQLHLSQRLRHRLRDSTVKNTHHVSIVDQAITSKTNVASYAKV